MVNDTVSPRTLLSPSNVYPCSAEEKSYYPNHVLTQAPYTCTGHRSEKETNERKLLIKNEL